MASETLLIFVLMLSSVRVGKSAETLFNLTCEPAVGVIGQTTHISCSIESQTGPGIINAVSLTRFRENNSCFTFQPYENRVTGDSRFKVESLPSLQLHNTSISDEGGYRYYIRTSQGNANAEFTVSVTAKYSAPIITSVPKEIMVGGAADLYCIARGGYPRGTIHWFESNTNWTPEALLQITQDNDGLFTLTSILRLWGTKTDWTPIRCVILNYRYEEEEERTFIPTIADLFNLKCQSAVGVIGQTTHISCSMKSQIGRVITKAVFLTRSGEKYPCFTFQPLQNIGRGDSRFKVESLPSLQLHNTSISDEGGYRYYIRTNMGMAKAKFTIRVTAEYSSPIITSEPTEIENGGAVDLYCRASGGYPAGTIHWFDQRNTNWTKNSTLQITQEHDGLFTLSSKLSFRSIDTAWAAFRCVILNYRYEEEGESTTALGRKGGDSTVLFSVAAVVVITYLIICLVIVVLVKLRVTESE